MGVRRASLSSRPTACRSTASRLTASRLTLATFAATLPLAALAALVPAACSEPNTEAPSLLTDDSGRSTKDGAASGGDSGKVPVPPDAARCNPANPFGPPELVTLFDPTADYVKGAILSADELEAFYLRYDNTASNWELRHARRSTSTDPFGPVETMPMAPSPDATLSLSAGSLKLYFWTIDSNYRATRGSTSAFFGAPVAFDVKSGPQPFVVAADDTAYFSKYEADGGGIANDKVIKRATLNTNGFSYTSTTVPNIHIPGVFDSNPVLNVSETVMYLSSNRPGGKGLADVWVARRQAKQLDFGAPINVPELSTDEPDEVTWVSNDECEVFLDRASHVYRAQRAK